jgi:hypothetical protein
MGAAEWREKYYPTRARDCARRDATQHSLTKWEGLRPEVLAEHGLTLHEGDVWVDIDPDDVPEIVLTLGSTSCSLCRHFLDNPADLVDEDDDDDDEASVGPKNTDPRCKFCPLAIVRNGVPCDSRDFHADIENVWTTFMDTRNPEQMIVELRRARLMELHLPDFEKEGK